MLNDIILIDEQIRKTNELDILKIPIYKKEYNELEITLEKIDTKNALIRNNIKTQLEQLNQKIEQFTKNTIFNSYVFKTYELLEEYKKLLIIPLKISFKKKNDTTSILKNELIDRYLSIISELNIYNVKYPEKIKEREVVELLECKNCKNTSEFEIFEKYQICKECGIQEEVITFMSSYTDSNRVSNTSIPYTYERCIHFRDTIYQFQGKQNCMIDSMIYTKLEEQFKNHHLLSDDNSTQFSRFKNITKTHVSMFLKELGFNKHYENTTLIFCNMTGKKPPDITHLEDLLLSDFKLLTETYDRLYKGNIERTNFISNQTILYQLLKRYNYDCNKNDFIMIKTVDRKMIHNEITNKLFTELGFNFYPM